MKKNLKLFFSATLAMLLIAGMALFPPKTLACGGDSDSEDGVATNCESAPEDADKSEEEPEEDDSALYFQSGSVLKSDADVENTLFVAGNDVSSNDRVAGIGFIAGNLLDLSGVYDYGFFAGNSIKISGVIKNDLFVAGNAVEIEDSTSVGRDVFAAGNTLKISANLSGNVFAGGNRLVLENVTIDGDLDVAFDEIVIKGKSSISGRFKHNANARISGIENLSFEKEETFVSAESSASVFSVILSKLVSICASLILAFVLLALFPKLAKTLLKNFERKSIFKHVLIGIAILVFAPLALIFAMMTVVGVPVSVVFFLFWVLFIFFSVPVSGLVTGNLLAEKVFKSKMNNFAKISLGVLLIELLSFIPYLGGLVSFVSVVFGMGYLLTTLIGLRKAK